VAPHRCLARGHRYRLLGRVHRLRCRTYLAVRRARSCGGGQLKSPWRSAKSTRPAPQADDVLCRTPRGPVAQNARMSQKMRLLRYLLTNSSDG
jgi:hypothetical protein